jgi:hypothetical protein
MPRVRSKPKTPVFEQEKTVDALESEVADWHFLHSSSKISLCGKSYRHYSDILGTVSLDKYLYNTSGTRPRVAVALSGD